MMEEELWKPELFKEYKAKKEAEMRAKMAQSGRWVRGLVYIHIDFRSCSVGWHYLH